MKVPVSGAIPGETALDLQLAEAVLARCDALGDCTDQQGIVLRTFLSPAMERCNQLVGTWMQDAGMGVSFDQAGNLHGVYKAAVLSAPRLIIASHLDTVPDAGKYDGILGVMLGIALVESLAGKRLPFAIEVIAFSDEEGVRYGLPFIGSRTLVGRLHPAHRELLDGDGIPLAAALDSFAANHPDAVPAKLDEHSCAYLEFHIEQGPVLEDARQALAVVDAIAGQSRATLTFRGHAGHAGTTPMALRRDAMTAAAEWLLAVESIAVSTPGLVASTGRVTCEPGAVNIIPGFARCSLDLRTVDDETRHRSLQSMLDEAHAISARRRIEVSFTIDTDQATVPLDPSLTQLAEQAVLRTQPAAMRMVSGAGHDAMIVAPHLPAAMIFLRSPGGVSHHPAEAVLVEDVAIALRTGMHFLGQFPQWMKEREHSECTI